MAGGDDLDLDQLLQFAVDLARQGGSLIKEAFHESGNDIEFKGNVDLVTRTDKAVERLLKESFAHHYPDFLFLGEEEASR
jgi:myo-inositol-1(or 4)-monophosphatase